MSKATLAHPSWTQIEKAAASICLSIARGPFPPTIILGLARGGLVPAVIMSHMLGIKMIPVSYSSKRGHGEYKQHENALPTFTGPENILIVDDICDTGYTMDEVWTHYVANAIEGHSVATAALYHKASACMIPSYVWQSIPADAPWIEFPWEM